MVFGQNENYSNFTEKKIESGSTFKKYKNGKLDSIIITMAAVNYGNTLIVSKSNNEIRITNAADKNSVIKIELKNKKQVRTLFYKEEPVVIVENIDFDIENLPKSTVISTLISDNMVFSNTYFSNDKMFGDDFPDKTFKLFHGLTVRPDLDNLDAIFENIGDFFSEEDALLKIFYGSYAEKFAPQVLAFLKTDASGKIKDGIFMDFKNKKINEKNNYNIYKNGKIIKSEAVNLNDFQKVFINYREKSYDN
ncbi:hypothetical protein AR685_00890 [Chryseobacterium sp. JAH]|nr:hypothetical protein AR685_00890 [Chryseobacterium sp. JAH]